MSGAKVKKETENSSSHACGYLVMNHEGTIEMRGEENVNLLRELQAIKKGASSLFHPAYASADFAFSTSAENATLSNTAMSARILRSISMAAFFRPLMKRL